ncbi:MAG: glycosyltransferase family 2 protein [Candidatus Hydrogenedentes bacterium]|nr:glycosyltransferase family 2 protein [Candidatus Hydrogenedentota bacterium]
MTEETSPTRGPLPQAADYPKLDVRESACDVSVVIVNWNTCDLLRACLQSLFAQTRRATYEVVVVDNASADGSADMVARDFPEVVLVRNARNEGFARGCNQGMQAGRGRYFLLLNSDTTIVEDAVSDLVSFMDKFEGAGAGGCALLFPDGYLQPSCGWFPSLRAGFFRMLSVRALFQRVVDKRKHFSSPFLSYAQHWKERDVDWIVGACLIVRREAAEQVGLMDETIFLFAEEWDWCYRIKKAGWRIIYTPGPKVIHLGSASWTMSDGKRVRAILASQQYFYRKHFGRTRATMFKIGTCLGSLMKSLIWVSLYLVYPSRRPFFRQRIIWNLHTLQWCLQARPSEMLKSADVVAPALSKSTMARGG